MLLHAVENQIFKKAAPMAIRHLPKPDQATKDATARMVLDQAKVEFQIAPPLTVHQLDPDLLAGVWHATRETYVVDAARRALREVVAWAVSETNECPYCVTVHSGMYASAAAGASDDPMDEVTIARTWAAASQTKDAPEHKAQMIPAHMMPQIYGTAAVFHYVNRMVSVFLDESPVALPGTKTAVGERLVRSSFKALGKRIVSQDPEPGQGAVQIEAALPNAFRWAKDAPHVANALAHFAHAAENAGGAAVSPAVRKMVVAHLSNWDGQAPPLSRRWLEDDIAKLGAEDQPAGRLALLAARAAWQVDDGMIAEFRAQNPDDKALMQTVAWASFAATQRIASWWHVPTAKEA